MLLLPFTGDPGAYPALAAGPRPPASPDPV